MPHSLPKLYSATEAAVELGCHKTTVARLCGAFEIGTRVGGRIVLTPFDVRKLKDLVGERGNPTFAGNTELARKAGLASAEKRREEAEEAAKPRRKPRKTGRKNKSGKQ